MSFTRGGALLIMGAVLGFTLVSAYPQPLPAQVSDESTSRHARFFWGVDVGTAALSAFVQGRSRKVPVKRALIGGLAGGTLMYVGQRMVGTGRPGLRLLGLQTVAAGASVTRNVGTGHAAWAELTFPLFPLYLQVRPGGHPRASVRLSAVALGGLVKAASEYRQWPDWRESLTAGMPVFVVDDPMLGDCEVMNRFGRCASGVLGDHLFGAVAFARVPLHLTARNVLAHELGHSAQDVRDAVLHAVPASDLVLRTFALGRFLSRFVVVDVVLPLDLASHAAGPPTGVEPACESASNYYECEAEVMIPQ